MGKPDPQFKKDIEDELGWDPKINAAQIGVTVEKGAVSLRGAIDTNAEKWAAEDAVKRMNGVCAFAEDLSVNVLDDAKHSDSDIAAAIQSALKWDVFVPTTVTAKVERGMVALEGQAAWNYKRDSAKRAIRCLSGVCDVFNSVTLKPQPSAAQVKEKVEAALQRHWPKPMQSRLASRPPAGRSRSPAKHRRGSQLTMPRLPRDVTNQMVTRWRRPSAAPEAMSLSVVFEAQEISQ